MTSRGGESAKGAARSPSPLESAARAVVEILEALEPGGDLEPARVLLAEARSHARGWPAEALELVSKALETLEDAPSEERFRRFDLALEAVALVEAAAAKPSSVERPAAVLDALAGDLSPRGAAGFASRNSSEAAPAPLRSPSRPPAPGESRAPVADALEELSAAVVALSGPGDREGLAAVVAALGDVRKIAMETGGGEHRLLEALDTTERLAVAGRSGELAATVDVRALLGGLATALGELASGDATASKRIAQLASTAQPRVRSAPTPGSEPREPLRSDPAARTEHVTVARPDPAAGTGKGRGAPVVVSLASEREMVEGFLVESREHLATAESGLLALETNPGDTATLNALFRAFHSIKGVAGLLALGPVVRLTHALESLLDAARKGRVATPGEAGCSLDRGAIDVLLEARDLLSAQVDAVEQALAKGAAQATLPGPEQVVASLEAVLKGEAVRSTQASSLPPPQRGEGRGGGLSETPGGPPPNLPPAEAGGRGMPVGAAVPAPVPVSAPAPSAVSSGVRVPMDRLDHLVELVGELVISQAQVGHDLASDETDAGIAKETNRLGKITREVQDLSLTLRMLPIQPVFQKLQRLVRDVARTTGKEVKLETDGEETRLDKSVIDEIEDPLVHMVRNAIDHGLEEPDARRRAGKPETGRIKVSARHAGGEIRIEIEDDGKGLDTARILEKARARGLAPLDQVPPEATIFHYIFEPGLSTAQKVT
jgi:HPt (histidine-containing phosphotransfer) domain-containing protein